MRRNHMLRTGLTLVAAVSLAGCLSAFSQPEVRFEGLRLGGLGLTGGTLYARLNIVNPNGFELRTTGLSYDLELSDASDSDGWTRLAQGTYDEEIRVAGKDSMVVEIPIDFSYDDVSGALRSIVQRGTFDYRVSGIVEIRDPINRNIPYRREGKISLDGVR